eukprot:NODE_4036_length_852_cov_42.027586_g3879_i0.p1 GENE.NODE_4036_length_852_cov_42.027586_g3879_i0~~NODE_4036_length_852_cov_42.027586_g3879_i0.p1  ORF type:complete len:228 (-),score=54.10 NODE_4036_length_852_cov_42.027586_g3879_i0:160-843(-)
MAHMIPFPDKFHLASRYMDHHHPLETDETIDTSHRLALYSLYQQATVGPINTKCPSLWYVTERAKWDAWNSLGKMSQLEAMVFYVQLVEKEVDADWLSKATELNEDSKDNQPSPKGDSRQVPETLEECVDALKRAWQELDNKTEELRAAQSKITSLQSELTHAPREAQMPLSPPTQQNHVRQAKQVEPRAPDFDQDRDSCDYSATPVNYYYTSEGPSWWKWVWPLQS